MKKLTVTLLILAAIFSTKKLYAQEADLYSYMDQYLTSEEKELISRAKANFDKAKKLDAQIQEEDSKNSKYFSKKAKKAEKKSVDAKMLRIKQGIGYEGAYGSIYSVYADKTGGAVFVYEEDEEKVNKMLEEASADNASASKKIKPYKSVTPKDLKKDVAYSKLKSDIDGMCSLYESAIKKLIEAYTVVVDQEQKKQQEEEENRVWQNALSDNTIYGFQSYLNDYPNGKHATEARSQIADLEAIEKKKQDEIKSRSIQGDLIFKVQIAASKVKLAPAKLGQIYKGAKKDIEEKFYDEWYKYTVGSFKTYPEAKTYISKIKVKGAFVVAFKGGTKIDIREATGAGGL
jgi:hypothetical protein